MTIEIKEQWHIRHATEADIPAIVALSNTCSQALTGEPDTDADQIAQFWARPEVDPATDVWLAFAPDGQLVGHAGFSDRAPHVALWSFASVHPDFEGRGIGSRLIRLTEDRAREVIRLAPADARVVLWRDILEQENAARELFITHGYESGRHSWRMRIELDEQPSIPVFPAGVRMRSIDPDRDVLTVYRTIKESFRDHWGYVEESEETGLRRFKTYMETNAMFDPTLWFLAVSETPDGEDIAGVTLCDPKTVSDPDMAYIEILGVRRTWRRQGIGLAMLQHALDEFYRRGIARASLHVDADSLTGATRLYEKAGMSVDRQYEEFEKELRPGRDLMTQTLD